MPPSKCEHFSPPRACFPRAHSLLPWTPNSIVVGTHGCVVSTHDISIHSKFISGKICWLIQLLCLCHKLAMNDNESVLLRSQQNTQVGLLLRPLWQLLECTRDSLVSCFSQIHSCSTPTGVATHCQLWSFFHWMLLVRVPIVCTHCLEFRSLSSKTPLAEIQLFVLVQMSLV